MCSCTAFRFTAPPAVMETSLQPLDTLRPLSQYPGTKYWMVPTREARGGPHLGGLSLVPRAPALSTELFAALRPIIGQKFLLLVRVFRRASSTTNVLCSFLHQPVMDRETCLACIIPPANEFNDEHGSDKKANDLAVPVCICV